MPLVKCRFCGKERRISLGSNLLPSEVNDLHVLCQPSCFKMLHSRGTFADLNQKEVLVPIIDIFHDMDLQQKAMANIDVAMTHRAENSTMRQQDIAATPPSGGPADRHSNTNCGSNGVDNGPPLTTPSLVDFSAVSQPHSLHSSADHDSTPLHRRSPSSDIPSSANYRFPSAQPPPRSITTPPPTADMRSLYIPPVHYTSSLRATSAEQPTTGPSDLPPAFEPSPPLQPAASSDYLRIIERFRSRRLEDLDDRNNVLRLDLTPAIDLRTPLAAAETAAIIGCLENVEFVVVVQGLAARLNASYWTVSFLLTSLPPLLPVQCDHYRADRHGVMTFVGSVLVPLRAVHAHFLHGSPVQLPYPDGPVVVDGGPDDGLALHDMELAFHSTL
ncbi:hypothetical protein DYB30_013884, partial [Aphanomyces astaci]